MQRVLHDGEWYVFARCPACATGHAIPQALYDAGQLRRNEMSIYCPNGHSWHYARGETDVVKLRRERDRLKQKLAELIDERDAAVRRAEANYSKLQRLETRTKNGVCPCCSRSFVNLRRHVATKHPEFRAN
ncbi:hypothetical protein V3589_14900 [Sinorhizobium fredii]|uniref:hypothetical protein n=1 Tax=Rhizobium fredii TaxID=380 RepID=UPI0030A832E3